MTPEALYLLSLGQALATMGLYPGGHPARERAIDASLEQLLAILADVPSLQFSFLGGESIVGQRPMTELPGWEWASKLSAVQIERIEFDAGVTPEAYLRFVDDIWNQLSGTRTSTAAWQRPMSTWAPPTWQLSIDVWQKKTKVRSKRQPLCSLALAFGPGLTSVEPHNQSAHRR